MRFLVFLLALSFASQVWAQEATSIAGFRIGMSVADARGVDRELRWPRGEQNVRVYAASYRALGGVDLAFNLIFLGGALDHVGGGDFETTETAAACMERYQSVLTAIEQTAGPLAAAEADVRPSDLEPVRTPGGSYVRRTGDESGYISLVATTLAPSTIEVRGYSYPRRDQGFECYLLFSMSAPSPPPADLPESTVRDWTFLATPDVSRYYPAAAVEFSRPGDVIMICTVAADGAMTCTVGHESPQGWGFGEAALRAMRGIRMAPTTKDGEPTAGATVRQTLRFRPSY
jgi:hypothetical protein